MRNVDFVFGRGIAQFTRIPEDGDDSDDDDDVQIGGVTQDYKCPLSLTILVDPLTSCVTAQMLSKYNF